MKKHLLGLLLLAPGLALAQSPTTYPYVVKGKIGTLNAPAKVYLMWGTQTLDSAAVKDGRFELKGSTPQPSTVELVLERQGHLRDGWKKQLFHNEMQTVWVKSPDRLELFSEPTPVTISSPDSVLHAHVSGGPLTTDYQRLSAATSPLISKMNSSANSPGESQALFKAYRQTYLSFAKTNPTSLVGLFALQQYTMIGPPSYAEAAPIYASLSPSLRGSELGQQLGTMLEKLQATIVGAVAPNFTQTDAMGKPVKLSDYRGKYVLIDFWASWCGPCRAENPNVLAAYNAFKNKNFAVLGVSLDNNRGKWLKAVAEDKLPWTQASDLKNSNEAAQRYNVQSIPQNFLIDPSGKIVAANLRGEELQATLAKLLK